jgi:predicted DNA-binding ribbon-helix-helix protein
MKATKKQIAEVTRIANEMNFSVEKALDTLMSCSASIYQAIGAEGVIESAIRVHSEHFVNTLELAKIANRRDVSIASLMTDEQRIANWAM